MNAGTDENTVDTVEMPSAETVAVYLREHPDFFNRYPDVLRDIEITHASGDAVSLLERQVSALRDGNRRAKERFDELATLATSNQELIQRIHQLALSLMEAAGLEAIFATITQRLALDFNADHARSFIFGSPSFVDASPLPEFVGKDSPIRELFGDLLDAKIPKCGPLTSAQSNLLLELGIPLGGSAALLPLSGNTWVGLLIISSDDEARFKVDMGTEFLAYLGDIVSLVVDPWVAKGEKI